MKGKKNVFYINSKGTRVKKCCASCKFKRNMNTDGPSRHCVFGGKRTVTDKSFFCSDWMISEQIDKIKTNINIIMS